MIEEQYVSFETAKLAKEKGFDESVRKYFTPKGDNTFINYFYLSTKYLHGIARPTQSLLARWLREKHKLFIEVTVDFIRLIREGDSTKYYPVYYYKIINLEDSVWTSDKHEHHSYEEAMEDGLQEALKLLQ